MIWWTRTAPPHSSLLYTACAFTHHPCQFGHVCISRGTWQIDSPADVQRESPERNHGRICFDTPTYLGRHSSECFSSPITRCNSLRFSRDLRQVRRARLRKLHSVHTWAESAGLDSQGHAATPTCVSCTASPQACQKVCQAPKFGHNVCLVSFGGLRPLLLLASMHGIQGARYEAHARRSRLCPMPRPAADGCCFCFHVQVA